MCAHVSSRWRSVRQEWINERRRLPLSYIECSVNEIFKLVSAVRSRRRLATVGALMSLVSTGSRNVTSVICGCKCGRQCNCWCVPVNEVTFSSAEVSNVERCTAWMLCRDRVMLSRLECSSRN